MDDLQMMNQQMEQQMIDQQLMQKAADRIGDPVQRDMIHHDWTKPKGQLSWKSLIVLLAFVLIVLMVYLLAF